jgi:hypothetical protein
MYETRQSLSESPETAPALVLVDEIDVHMHPEWQQKLVPKLRELLPQLQVIATTHSPLIVSSMHAGEVVRFIRNDENRLDVARLEDKILGYRADQVLTSPAFSLASTRGGTSEERIARYTQLLGKSKLTDLESAEMTRLRETLRDLLAPSETELQRHVEKAVEVTVSQLAAVQEVSAKPRLAPAVELEVRRQLKELLGTPKEPG